MRAFCAKPAGPARRLRGAGPFRRETRLIAGACVPSERAALGIRAMRAGKDYFTDKGAADHAGPARGRARGRRADGPQVHGQLQRAPAIGGRGAGRRAGAPRGHRPRDPGAGARAAPAPGRHPPGLVLCAGEVRRHPMRHRQPPGRAVSLTIQARRTRTSSRPRSPTTRIRSSRSWTTLATARSWPTTARRATSAWIGSRRTACAPGATAARSCWARRATSRCANMWTSPAARRKTSSFLVDGAGEHEFHATGRTASSFFGRLILDCLNRTGERHDPGPRPEGRGALRPRPDEALTSPTGNSPKRPRGRTPSGVRPRGFFSVLFFFRANRQGAGAGAVPDVRIVAQAFAGQAESMARANPAYSTSPTLQGAGACPCACVRSARGSPPRGK